MVEKVIANGSPAAKGLVPKDLAFDSNGKDFSTQTTSKVSYDAKKAKDYWEKAKKELGVDSLEIEFLTEDTDNSKKMAEYLQGSIQDTLDGITVKVANVPFSVKIDRSHSGDFDMAMNGWGADYADPSSFMDLFTSDNSYNYGKWSNPEYDKLVKAASTTDANDPEKRWQDYIDAENIIVDECGVIPIYQKAEAHLISPKVKGIVNHASGVKREYKWVHIDD